MQRTIGTYTVKSSALATAISNNDEVVLNKLYADNYFKTEKYVLENNGSVAEAKDVFQEAFIATWRNVQLQKFNPENESDVGAYLFKVVKYKWIDLLRSAGKGRVIPIGGNDVAETAMPDGLTDEEQKVVLLVRKKYAELGENCRTLLEGFYFKKRSLKAIAAQFNWTEQTARNNKYRCMQQLRNLLKK